MTTEITDDQHEESAEDFIYYEDVADFLQETESDITPEEMHGLMAGWLCVNFEEDKDWKTILFPETADGEIISALYDSTEESLSSDDFDFNLLLPSDEEPLAARAEALVGWCQGFLAGFGLTGFNVDSLKDIQEPIEDLTEISKLDCSSLCDDDEEDQSSFEEVSEYVRMAVMLIFTEILVMKDRATDSAENDVLH